MANVLDWLAAGKPSVKKWTSSGYQYILPNPPGGGSWKCDAVAEQGISPRDRDAWYAVKPGCRGAYEATKGKAYSPSLGGFVGTFSGGATSPTDAKKITYVPPPPAQPRPGISASTGLNDGLAPQAINTNSGATPMVSTAKAGSLSSLGSLFSGAGTGASVGGPVGGVVGGLIGLGSGLIGSGKSKCPGPYNYNPMTGGCDPKPRALVGGVGAGPTGVGTGCPPGSTYDAASGKCKVGGISGAVQRTLPGGQTGYVEPTGNWQPTQAYGTTGIIPQSVATSRLECPRGYVLYGKEPGMEVCFPRGMLPNKMRKWPKSPNPALSAQDMKTLRRIGTLQKKIKRVSGLAGFTCRKR